MSEAFLSSWEITAHKKHASPFAYAPGLFTDDFLDYIFIIHL